MVLTYRTSDTKCISVVKRPTLLRLVGAVYVGFSDQFFRLRPRGPHTAAWVLMYFMAFWRGGGVLKKLIGDRPIGRSISTVASCINLLKGVTRVSYINDVLDPDWTRLRFCKLRGTSAACCIFP